LPKTPVLSRFLAKIRPKPASEPRKSSKLCQDCRPELENLRNSARLRLLASKPPNPAAAPARIGLQTAFPRLCACLSLSQPPVRQSFGPGTDFRPKMRTEPDRALDFFEFFAFLRASASTFELLAPTPRSRSHSAPRAPQSRSSPRKNSSPRGALTPGRLLSDALRPKFRRRPASIGSPFRLRRAEQERIARGEKGSSPARGSGDRSSREAP